ncbi:MAG TPA: DinB family protein [Deinococcales bacterium]|nr:DinB family protein [Deinococcales bacterium]
MPEDLLFGPPAATLAALLDDPAGHDHASARRLLDGIPPERAATAPDGLPYSIAGLVAHANANLEFNRARIEGREAGEPVRWPPVEAAEWPALAETFLANLAALRRLAETADLNRVLDPPDGNEPGWTVGYKLAASVGKHTSYHLGQVAVLRRLLGLWSPGEP